MQIFKNGNWADGVPSVGDNCRKRIGADGFHEFTYYGADLSLIRGISYSAFRERFNIQSKIAIESATENDALVRLLEKDLQARGIDGKPIRLDSNDLAYGLAQYDAKGLLRDGLTVAALLRDGTPEEVL